MSRTAHVETTTLATLVADLGDEQESLLQLLLANLDSWHQSTPAAGWSIGDTLGHLWQFESRECLAIEDPDRFLLDRDALHGDLDALVHSGILRSRELPPEDLLAAWASDSAHLADLALAAKPELRVPWYGPSMSLRSSLTARLMESWAHGCDIRDSLGLPLSETRRLRHVAHLGFMTRTHSHAVRGLEVSAAPVRVELELPGEPMLAYGPASAESRIYGTALDFCLVVTQRRLLCDTSLEIHGDAASSWIGIAQVFAGPPSLTDPQRSLSSSQSLAI